MERGVAHREAAFYMTGPIRKAYPLRAETERSIADIKQALALLRRHL